MISDFDEERVRLRQENKEREKKQKQVELRLKRMQAFQARSELQEVDTEGDILIVFCKITIASVVDLLDLKPNWQFEIMFSYVSRILDITIDIIIFEQVAIIERPL